jgi:hypothetical protein
MLKDVDCSINLILDGVFAANRSPIKGGHVTTYGW